MDYLFSKSSYTDERLHNCKSCSNDLHGPKMNLNIIS
jgi:hypothetical protein